MGRQHVEAMAQVDGVRLVSIVDPGDGAQEYAASLGVPWFSDLEQMMRAGVPDGIILATPNAMHVEQGLACIAAGIPVLVEKPIATDVRAAQRLVDAAVAANVPLLVGHHRRHNPIVQAARTKLLDGAVGKIVAVHAMCWLFKPDEYFETRWRREAGAGPGFVNLIHDVDVLRYLCGEIASVFARESRAVRGHAVEETLVVALTFESGALGTMSVSDTVVSPWSWELTAGENPAYPATGAFCYLIGGTHGSLEIPGAAVWRNDDKRGWHEPIRRQQVEFGTADPFVEQIKHFSRVIAHGEAPLVSGEEGLKTLRVIDAVKRSVAEGQPVALD